MGTRIAWSMTGKQLMKNNEKTSTGDAMEMFQQAARQFQQLNPDYADASHLMGVIAIQCGRPESACRLINDAISISPRHPLYHYSLGRALQSGGHPDKSLAAYDRAIQLNPDFAEAHNFRGIVLVDLGRPDDALAACERAVQLNSNAVSSNINLGNVLRSLGHFQEALAAYDRATGLNPDYSGAHNNRGNVLRDMGHLQEALAAYDKAVQSDPGLVEAHNNRGNVLIDLGQLNKALAAYGQAIQLKPGYAGAHYNRGNVLRDLGRFDQAERSYRRALELKPDDAGIHSSLLYLLAARAQLPPDRMLEEQRNWDEVHGREGLMHRMPVRRVNKEPGQRLRVGYVSPDLRRHVVSYFFEPVLAAHDSKHFEIFCYDTNTRITDATTERLHGLAEHWRFVAGKSDLELARLIHEDGIHILVDLSGHTRGNRLKAFTYCPAPVQATYLGGFSATGLSAMDYWITDEVLHPPDTSEKAVESIYRLPRCSFCYQPPTGMPAISPCPGDNDHVIFGSFSNLSKLTPEAIETWSQLLRTLPESQLLLMDKPLAEPQTRQLFLERFTQHGVSTEQLLLRKGAPFEEYMASYASVDIVLDPFPRTGGTTTAEALWMGLPVVTLAGQRYVERITASKLTAVGLGDLITRSRKEYIDKALSLAHDPERRSTLRRTLRDTMAQSALYDGEGLARAIEAAYKAMWEAVQRHTISRP